MLNSSLTPMNLFLALMNIAAVVMIWASLRLKEYPMAALVFSSAVLMYLLLIFITVNK